MIKDQDIIRTAKDLREEQNAQLHVRQWSRQKRSHYVSWLTAIPAAAIIGFLFGIWTSTATQDDTPMTAMVDTVYVKVPSTPTNRDTVKQTEISRTTPVTQQKKVSAVKQRRNSKTSPAGRSMADDQIRYDLLVRN